MRASSRLKPVQLKRRVQSVRTDMNADVGPALAGKPSAGIHGEYKVKEPAYNRE